MMAIFDGSHTRGSRPVVLKISWNWLMTSAAFSCDIARSTSGSTTSPTATNGRPVARARIFWVIVIPAIVFAPYLGSLAARRAMCRKDELHHAAAAQAFYLVWGVSDF